jgi:mannose-6-phosphate isomerase-like protein (cupin superfamily)
MLAHEERPWGSFTDLYHTEFTRVKTLVVLPRQRLSLQSHSRRAENWTVVLGTATIEINGEIFHCEPGESIQIPTGAKHRLENNTSELLEVIEVQTGDYFGEDDIVRYEDDYQRC